MIFSHRKRKEKNKDYSRNQINNNRIKLSSYSTSNNRQLRNEIISNVEETQPQVTSYETIKTQKKNE